MLQPDLRAAVEGALGARIAEMRRLGGGDINVAQELLLRDGRRVFLKSNAGADPAMFPAEARGLSWLAEAKALRIPRVLAVSDGGTPAFLVLEHLTSRTRKAGFEEELGRGLAALHRSGAPAFGLDHPNFIGSLPQDNRPAPSWAPFWRERRLAPQIERAASAGHLAGAVRRDLDHVLDHLEDLVGPAEPPSRLHGDLWGGNLHVGPGGEPVLIDPAVYGGHREVDLAMMRLFGGFGARCFAAYEEAWPLAPGHEERVALYQLYPLLVHLNLFGSGYAEGVARAVRRYV